VKLLAIWHIKGGDLWASGGTGLLAKAPLHKYGKDSWAPRGTSNLIKAILHYYCKDSWAKGGAGLRVRPLCTNMISSKWYWPSDYGPCMMTKDSQAPKW